jgi:hypothetical protein
MYFLIPLLLYLKGWMTITFQLLKLRFISSAEKDLEILALRSQLALYEGELSTLRANFQNANSYTIKL